MKKIRCACGCGQLYEEKDSQGRLRKFISGHQCRGKHHSKETKKKISLAHIGKRSPMWGKHHSKKTKEKMSKAHIKLKLIGKRHSCWGKHHSKETKEKISQSRKGKYSDKNHPMWGKENKWGHHTKKTRQKISKILTGRHLSKKHKKKLSSLRIGQHSSKKTKEKISKNSFQIWKKHPEWREQARQRCITMLQNGFRPSKFEKRIMRLIKQKHLPWKYIGDGREGSFFGKVPDFINTNGQKAFAEAYDDYWHDKDYVPKRRKYFAKFGFKTKFIHYKDNDEKIVKILGK